MCAEIIGKDFCVHTVGELKRKFPWIKIFVKKEYEYSAEDDGCLCQIDILKTLRTAGIRYKQEAGDYVI